MEFQAKTEKELQEEACLPAGDYDFEVLEASEGMSKKGNPMLTLLIGLYVGDKIRRKVKDYITSTMGFKLRHFCDSVGLLKQYEQGSLTAEVCAGRSGKCKLFIDDSNLSFPAHNAVKDYITRAAKPLASELGSAPSANDQGTSEGDNLPF